MVEWAQQKDSVILVTHLLSVSKIRRRSFLGADTQKKAILLCLSYFAKNWNYTFTLKKEMTFNVFVYYYFQLDLSDTTARPVDFKKD